MLCFKILHVTFSISSAIIGVHVTNATGANTPPPPVTSQMLVFEITTSFIICGNQAQRSCYKYMYELDQEHSALFQALPHIQRDFS